MTCNVFGGTLNLTQPNPTLLAALGKLLCESILLYLLTKTQKQHVTIAITFKK